jgi:predicted nucleic acid-binding protein
MARKTPLITVSAVVTPVIAEEIAALAKANKMTKSQMVRQLLEERLVQRANQRTEDAYDRLEKRLKRIEDRFSGLVIACTKLAAQAVYLTVTMLRYGKSNNKEQLDKHWDNSIKYAAEQVTKKLKTDEKPDKAES